MGVGYLTQWGSSWPRERVCGRGGIRKNCGNLWKRQKPQVQNRHPGHPAEATRLYNDLKDQREWPNHERLADIVAFASKRETIPLQVADLAAYETYKHLDNRLFHSERPVRWPLRQFGSKFSGKYFDAAAFTKLLGERPSTAGA